MKKYYSNAVISYDFLIENMILKVVFQIERYDESFLYLFFAKTSFKIIILAYFHLHNVFSMNTYNANLVK